MLSTSSLVVGFVGVSAVGAVAARGVYRKRLNRNEAITPNDFHQKQHEKIKEVLHSAESLRSTSLRLFQFQTCPYCYKVKAFLDYHKVSYNLVEVNPLNKKEIISEYQKVPQLQLGDNGPFLVDSKEIVKMIKPLVDPEHPEISKEEEKWDKQTKSLLGLLVLNTNRNLSEAKNNFSYADQTPFSAKDKFILSKIFPFVMFFITKRFIRPRVLREGGYDKDMNERDELYKDLNNWIEKGIAGKKFHGGEKPSLADLNYYGILRSQSPFDVFEDIKNTCKTTRVYQLVFKHARSLYTQKRINLLFTLTVGELL